MNAKEMLEEFKSSAAHQDRNSRLTEVENSLKFLEAKLAKIEKVLKDIPSYYVLPGSGKKKLNEATCGKCIDSEKRIEKLLEQKKRMEEHYEKRFENSVNIKKAHYEVMENDIKDLQFLIRRVVAIYGNKALVDLFNHVDNPNATPERLEQYMKVKPHF